MKKIVLKLSFVLAAALFFSCSTGGNDRSFSDNGMTTFSSTSNKSPASGEGGSMARICILGDYMYAVDYASLKVFNISDPQNVQYLSSVDIGRNIETIFGFKNNLYIGSEIAVYIYDVTNPERPTQIEMIQHMTACDPVVANDTLAFATIRSTSECRPNQWGANQLILMDVRDVNNTVVTRTYDLSFSPFGIGLEDNEFFLCKGSAGIDVFHVNQFNNSPAQLPTPVSTIQGVDAFDVIPVNDVLIVVGSTGMTLYDISNVYNIQKLSEILPD